MEDDPRQPLLVRSEEQGEASHVREASDTSDRKLGAVDSNSEVTVTGGEVRAATFMHSSADSFIPFERRDLDARLRNQGQNLLDNVLKRVQAIEEEEIRELLLDHGGFNCWGDQPISNWSIQRVEDCNAYIGTLETFIEERDVVDEVQPYLGGDIDGKDKGRMPDAWEVDMKAEIPLHFTSEKEARKKMPNSEMVKVCEGCLGCGKLAYNRSKSNIGSRHQTPDRMVAISTGSGRCSFGAICKNCEGSQGWMRCKLCCGQGALLHRKVLVVRWRTVVLKRVCASKNAKSVPDEVFHRAKGVHLYQSQSYQCESACFPYSDSLSRFSESVISERNLTPESARIICERHQISLMPVTRVVMANRKKSMKFYILGLSREIYAKENPARRFSLCGICSIC